MDRKQKKSKQKKPVKSENESIEELKKKIKHQKNALTKIIKTYTHEK